VARTSPNAAPVREVLHSFVLGALVEGSPTVGCQPLAETTVRLQGWSRERRIVIVRTLKPTNPTPQDLFWDTPEDEVAVFVTNLERGEATPEQVALLYAQRADTENVFDELKNQWRLSGVIAAGRRW
jgi:hypothetical protein